MTKCYKLLNELLDCGGVVASGDWTNGSGRYVTKKAIPVHCSELAVQNIDGLVGEVKKSAKRLLKQRPNLRKLVVVTDLRAARRLVA